MEKSKSAPHLDDNPDLAPPITFHLPQGNMDTRRSNNQDEKWKIGLRSYDDDETEWWFASTAVPVLVVTIAPLANLISIAALVSSWRMSLDDGQGNLLPQLLGLPQKDPDWVHWPNVCSLICGFLGNIFLILNFTGRVRYIVALPFTIICFCAAFGILVGITSAIHIYAPPSPPMEVYTQGYWYAIMAAVLYFTCSIFLLLNMLGYLLGHYPQRFNLTDDQRTMIIPTIVFFIWLAIGGLVFSHIESKGDGQNARDWTFVDGIYYCDITILTIGMGDLYPHDNLGRGLVIPYSLGGILLLGLVISSLHKVVQMGKKNVVKSHLAKERSRTFGSSVTEVRVPTIERPPFSNPYPNTILERTQNHQVPPTAARNQVRHSLIRRRPKLILMKEEKDRFNAMRRIQKSTIRFMRWWRLFLSGLAFAILWCIGAVVFWRAERHVQGMSYFQSLYFSYVNLLTIGSINFAPKSNAGRAFFVVWSIVAVPTMTVLISDMSETVFDSFRTIISTLGSFTFLPRPGAWRDFVEQRPYLKTWIEKRERRRRIRLGMPFATTAETDDGGAMSVHAPGIPLEELAEEAEQRPVEGRLARRLATAIMNVATDLQNTPERNYSYEEWVEITRLIRFTSESSDEAVTEEEENERGMIEWDWIGEDSPLSSGLSEPNFVFNRLCESLVRYIRQTERRIEEYVSILEKRKRRVGSKEDYFGAGYFIRNEGSKFGNAGFDGDDNDWKAEESRGDTKQFDGDGTAPG